MVHSLLLPDGTWVSSGAAGSAICTLKLTARVCPGEEADPGGVCARVLEVEFFDEGLHISPGDRLELWRGDTPLGVFYADSPRVPGPGRLALTAYGVSTKFDIPAQPLLDSLSWPLTLSELVAALGTHCGVEITGTLANADCPLGAFRAPGATCRQVLGWACQLGARFTRETPQGTLELGWFTPSGLTLGPTGTDFYFQGTLNLGAPVAPLGGVVLALGTDLGVCFPENPQNSLKFDSNPLFSTVFDTHARAIFEALGDTAYTPCTLETPTPLEPGTALTVVREGTEHRVLCMEVEASGGRYKLRCTGSPSRDASSAQLRRDYRSLGGRMAGLRLELSGIRTQMAQLGQEVDQFSEISQDVDRITARVALLEVDSADLAGDLEAISRQTAREYSQLTQRSDSLELTLGSLRTDLDQKADAGPVETLTQRFRFDSRGLTISDSATGMGIRVSQEQVAFTGGSGENTAITPTGMNTTHLQVADRLTLGHYTWLPRTNGNLSLRFTG